MRLAVAALIALAWGHAETGAAIGLKSGFLHPLTGLDHVLAMVAVGLWGAQLGRPAIWALPVAFPLVMTIGALLGFLGVPLPGVEYGIALSAIVLGAFIVADRRVSPWLAAVVVAVFAIFHGHAHGAELPEGESSLLYSIGFVVATGLLHACGIALGELHRLPWGRPLVRVLGGVVVLGGGWFLLQALR